MDALLGAAESSAGNGLSGAAVGAIIVAVITAVASIVVAVITNWRTRDLKELDWRSAENLESLKSALESSRQEATAQREYEFDARKRLYAEGEPLFFRLHDALDDARQRVFSIARSARQGRLDPALGDLHWLRGNSYYLYTSAYYLMAPVAYFPLVQRRLTAVDLDLEPRVRTQYRLLRVLSWAFSEGHDLAEKPYPKLDYDPKWGQTGVREAVERPQHLPLGNIGRIAESLVRAGSAGELPRVMSYGEFLTEMDPTSETPGPFDAILDLLDGFNPGTRPVLWRVLVYQVLIYEAMMTAFQASRRAPGPDLDSLVDVRPRTIDQCRWIEGQPNEEARKPLDAAAELLRDRLQHAADPLRWQ